MTEIECYGCPYCEIVTNEDGQVVGQARRYCHLHQMQGLLWGNGCNPAKYGAVAYQLRQQGILIEEADMEKIKATVGELGMIAEPNAERFGWAETVESQGRVCLYKDKSGDFVDAEIVEVVR